MTCVALPPKVFPATVAGLLTHVDPDVLASESDGGLVQSVTPARSAIAVAPTAKSPFKSEGSVYVYVISTSVTFNDPLLIHNWKLIGLPTV